MPLTNGNSILADHLSRPWLRSFLSPRPTSSAATSPTSRVRGPTNLGIGGSTRSGREWPKSFSRGTGFGRSVEKIGSCRMSATRSRSLCCLSHSLSLSLSLSLSPSGVFLFLVLSSALPPSLFGVSLCWPSLSHSLSLSFSLCPWPALSLLSLFLNLSLVSLSMLALSFLFSHFLILCANTLSVLRLSFCAALSLC